MSFINMQGQCPYIACVDKRGSQIFRGRTMFSHVDMSSESWVSVSFTTCSLWMNHELTHVNEHVDMSSEYTATHTATHYNTQQHNVLACRHVFGVTLWYIFGITPSYIFIITPSYIFYNSPLIYLWNNPLIYLWNDLPWVQHGFFCQTDLGRLNSVWSLVWPQRLAFCVAAPADINSPLLVLVWINVYM